ncbi:MAG: hypothetical protein KIT69_20485, partial [Propionibacteriaceae bacterium]|nr:hypothetical protein [Propionibacteriaceae bacterium]
MENLLGVQSIGRARQPGPATSGWRDTRLRGYDGRGAGYDGGGAGRDGRGSERDGKGTGHDGNSLARSHCHPAKAVSPGMRSGILAAAP